MSAGKKGKKTKGKQLSLGDFLNSGAAPSNTVQVPVKVKSWADECEDDDDDKPLNIKVFDLPTAPKASRVFNEDNFPTNPPFQVYISNLPYDLNEDDLYDFFGNMVISSIRLPREDGDTGRLRGFGYVEFETRQDLIDAVSIPDPVLRNRRIRIEVSSENDQKRGNRGNRNYESRSGNDDSGNTNWRDRPDMARQQPERRNYNRDYNRDKDREREDRPADSAGSWRTGERPVIQQRSPPPERRQYGGSGGGDRRRPGQRNEQSDMPRERPKIVLQPRTLPLPELPKPPPEDEDKENEVALEPEPEKKPEPVKIPAANIFGAAKPVDTAAREREIEMKLQEQERQAKERQAKEKLREEREREKIDKEKEEQVEKVDPVKDEEIQEVVVEKKPEEIISWRIRTEPKDGENAETNRRSPPSIRKFSPDRKGVYNNRRNDDRRKDNRDNRDTRDNRNVNRDNKSRDNNRNRDYNRTTDIREKEREHKEKDKEQKPLEERMPKYHAPPGPNLSMTNQFAGLLPDDVDD